MEGGMNWKMRLLEWLWRELERLEEWLEWVEAV